MNNKKAHYYPKNIYYSLDGQNIFKRVDRYRHKLLLVILFSILILINFHEIIFNAVHLICRIDPDQPDKNVKGPFYNWNIASEFLCDLYIIIIQILSFYIFCKFGIETKIYY